MNRLLPLAGDRSSEMPMKNKTENQPCEMITREVTRILFGDENPSGMPLRLTSIALEHYHVPDMIRRPPETNGQNGSPANLPSVGVYK
jgi:hypothetical protein